MSALAYILYIVHLSQVHVVPSKESNLASIQRPLSSVREPPALLLQVFDLLLSRSDNRCHLGNPAGNPLMSSADQLRHVRHVKFVAKAICKGFLAFRCSHAAENSILPEGTPISKLPCWSLSHVDDHCSQHGCCERSTTRPNTGGAQWFASLQYENER